MPPLTYEPSDPDDDHFAVTDSVPPSKAITQQYKLLFPTSHTACCPDGTSNHAFLVDVGLTSGFAAPPKASQHATKAFAEAEAFRKRPIVVSVDEDDQGSSSKRRRPLFSSESDSGEEEATFSSSKSKGKGKAREVVDLLSDDEGDEAIPSEYRVENTGRRGIISDGESISERPTPPRLGRPRKADREDLEGFVVPDDEGEEDDDELLPAGFRSSGSEKTRGSASGSRITKDTPGKIGDRLKGKDRVSSRVDKGKGRETPKSAGKGKNRVGSIGTAAGLLKDKSKSTPSSVDGGPRASVGTPRISPDDNGGEGSSKNVPEASNSKSALCFVAMVNFADPPTARSGSAQAGAVYDGEDLMSNPSLAGNNYKCPPNDPLLRELRSTATNPNNPLPEPVFPSKPEGKLYKVHVRVSHRFTNVYKNVKDKSWDRLLENLDFIGFSGDIIPEYLNEHPSLRLIIKKIAFDKPPHQCARDEARARNVAAIIWARWYKGIYDPDPNLRIEVSQKGTRSQRSSDLGYVSGEHFVNREQIVKADLHRSYQGGIAGYKSEGAHSIVLSKSEYRDQDRGDWIWYSGTDSKDGVSATANTQLMETAMAKGNLIRVFRTKDCGWIAPHWGIRFDGMYKITDKRDMGKGNYQFYLVRERGQWPILYPTPPRMRMLERYIKK